MNPEAAPMFPAGYQMALAILMVVLVLLVPVAIGWRIAYRQLMQNPTRRVKLFFWVMSGLFIGLAAAAFVTTRFVE